jgi:tetrahydromethanopterin S-methyltransferase subunit F
VFFYINNIIVMYSKERRLEAQAAVKDIKNKYSIIGRDDLY